MTRICIIEKRNLELSQQTELTSDEREDTNLRQRDENKRVRTDVASDTTDTQCVKRCTPLDEARTGRPPTAVTQENDQAVEKQIRENRGFTRVELERELGIGSAAMQAIFLPYAGRRLATTVIVNVVTKSGTDDSSAPIKLRSGRFVCGQSPNAVPSGSKAIRLPLDHRGFYIHQTHLSHE
ncbi:hypothetical protein EVAR_6239_1 [Eumeta japonica]|uniref:Uncharacterized protein n=1 Tax=Eumeta variegata TaxID=151549 RepID=A0A4C1TBI5_EUMVA|nr:hypothetical protein EVAR_6239_1 [Eumeta japonica]